MTDSELAAALALLVEDGQDVEAARLIAAELEEEEGLSEKDRYRIAAEIVAWMLEDNGSV